MAREEGVKRSLLPPRRGLEPAAQRFDLIINYPALTLQSLAVGPLTSLSCVVTCVQPRRSHRRSDDNVVRAVSERPSSG
jgi:hypothetical protein